MRSTKLVNSVSVPARPSMSSAQRKFEIALPPMLTVYKCVSHDSFQEYVERVGESRQPCLASTVVLNQSLVLPLKQTALVALS